MIKFYDNIRGIIMKKMWMVRAGENAYLLDEFISRSIVSMGWNEIGSIANYINRDELKDTILAQ